MHKKVYQCPKCNEGIIVNSDNSFCCHAGHCFDVLQVDGNIVPVFDCVEDDANDYSVTEAAQINDNATKWVLGTFESTEDELRTNLISRLHLKKGQKVLITGAGAGDDLPFLAHQIGPQGEIFVQDYSSQMLLQAVKRTHGPYELSEHNIAFSVSDATNLPFIDDYFDAVYHFGGLNLFSDIGKGIAEMDRVVKSGGRVVFGDEGMASWLKNTEYGKMIINNNKLCDYEPPLEFLPSTARNVNLSWAVGNCFYIIDYTKSSSSLPLNIDIPHIGKRGGTIRTRYFGKLEGINPELKKTIYLEAEKRNIGRVDFLETILRDGIKNI